MKKFTRYIVIAGVLFMHLHLHAQNKVADEVQQHFNAYRSHVLQEKLFLHSDKDFYVAGEILWFRIYDVNASSHQPLDLSKIAYVEVLDKNNKPVLQAKIALAKGSGNGSFYLPVSLTSGSYLLRAYTKWMKNFDPAFYFEKPLTIVNSLKPLAVQASNTLPAYDIQFFPEGGDLVQDIESKVGFRVTDQYGKGMEFTGVLINENNDSLVRFQPLVFGLGHFSFTPAAGHLYRAVIMLPGGETIVRPLPNVQPEGYVLQLMEEDSAIRLTINSKTPRQGIFVFAQSRQVPRFAEYVRFTNGSASITVNKNKLGDGITQFTVFDDGMQPVCERLYFNSPSNFLQLTAEGNQPQYGERKKVAFSVLSKRNADLSIAVYRLDSLQRPEEMNIGNYLWLTSELGPIESPSYYFSKHADVREAADNLMLTHGWRRFSWKKILVQNSYALPQPPEYDAQIVMGKITNAATGAPVPNIKTLFAVPGVQSQSYNTVSDSNGNFHFDVRDFFGQNEIIVQASGAAGSSYHIDIANPFSEQYPAHAPLPFSVSSSAATSLTASHISMQVQNAYAGDHLQKFTPPAIDTVPFFGSRCARYMLDNYTRFVTMEEVLREYVMEIGVRRRNGHYVLLISNGVARGFFDGEPLLLLDGIPVSDEKILNFDPLKVKKIEVVPYTYILGESVYKGVASFTTYTGAPEGLQYDSKTLVMDYEGLQLKREFYSPQYATEQQIASRVPDFRNLLYWSPSVRTDDTGKASIEFYTSDVKGKYLAVMQGLDADGNAGSNSFEFEVSGK